MKRQDHGARKTSAAGLLESASKNSARTRVEGVSTNLNECACIRAAPRVEKEIDKPSAYSTAWATTL